MTTPHNRPSRFDLEKAIAAWRRPFLYNRAFQKADVDELERHIRDEVAHRMVLGCTEEEAFTQALREMGGLVEAEPEYQKIYWTKLKQHGALGRELRWRGAMLANYVKLTYRNLLKQKAASLINIVGLSLALACSLVVYLFVQHHLSMDAFHEQADTIFLVGNVVDRNGKERISDRAPMPLGPVLEANFPQVERAVRIESGGEAVVRHQGEVFSERVWFADPGFFDLFTFPLATGDPSAIADEDAIFLSASAATRYFGQAPAVGQQLTLTFNQEYVRTFTVRGVAEPFPEHASFTFNLLVNFGIGQDVGGDAVDDWRSNTLATFIQLRDPADVVALSEQMEPYRQLQNAANEVWPISAFRFTNLRDVSRKAHLASTSIAQGTNPATLLVLPLLAVLLLVLSSFNYMNIAISQATGRLKEIGIRKVMGSHKSQVVTQFLSEHMLLCLGALGLAILATHAFLLPAFNALFDQAAPLRLSLADNLGLLGFLVALLLLTGVAAGSYPALYMASFNPVIIFRGPQHPRSQRGWFTQSLLVLQFMIAFLTMAAGLVFYTNARYQAERDWGYAKEQMLVIRLSQEGQYPLLADALRQHPTVVDVGGSIHHVMPRGSGPGGTFERPGGHQAEARRYDVSHTYLRTMGLRLKAGRLFDPSQATDATEALVINEAFAQALGLSATEALGERFPWDEHTTYTVIGVVDDFHEQDFSGPIQPSIFRIVEAGRLGHAVVRIQPGTSVQTEAAVAHIWAELFPDEPYEVFFQDTVFDAFYRENRRMTQIFAFGAGAALLISCLGLFGLTAQNITRRMKEISIRKVLGASVPHITQTVNQRFLVLLAIAALVALPLSYHLLDALLASMYSYRISLEAWPFLLAFAIVFLTAFLTIIAHTRKVSTAQPADILRNA